MSIENVHQNFSYIHFKVVEFLYILHYKYYYFNVFYIENGYKIILEPFKYSGRKTTSSAKMEFKSVTMSRVQVFGSNFLGFYSIPEKPNSRLQV